MRYPTHIILDISKPSSLYTTSNWTTSYKNFVSKNHSFVTTLTTLSTLKVSNKSIIKTPFSTTIIKSSSNNFNKKNTPTNTPNSLLWSLFDINFLKKEKMYTKLKYSRSPQYDIVSGGVAAIFAGFLGFLISEKFGIELVDSGDFYTFFMYLVFLSFSCRPFLKVLSKHETLYHFFSIKFLVSYLHTIFILILNYIRYFTLKSNFFVAVYNFLVNNEYMSNIVKKVLQLVKLFKNYPLNK